MFADDTHTDVHTQMLRCGSRNSRHQKLAIQSFYIISWAASWLLRIFADHTSVLCCKSRNSEKSQLATQLTIPKDWRIDFSEFWPEPAVPPIEVLEPCSAWVDWSNLSRVSITVGLLSKLSSELTFEQFHCPERVFCTSIGDAAISGIKYAKSILQFPNIVHRVVSWLLLVGSLKL